MFQVGERLKVEKVPFKISKRQHDWKKKFTVWAWDLSQDLGYVVRMPGARFLAPYVLWEPSY